MYISVGGRKKDQILEKKTQKRPKNCQKKDLSRPVFSDFSGKKQTSTDQVGPKNINAKSDN